MLLNEYQKNPSYRYFSFNCYCMCLYRVLLIFICTKNLFIKKDIILHVGACYKERSLLAENILSCKNICRP